MIDLGTIFSGIGTVVTVLDKVLPKRGTRIKDKIIAVTAMQKAINATEVYLTTSERNYIPNQDLSNLWLDAFTTMVKIDRNLAGRLRDKSRFWSNPQRWLREPSAMELVPTLKELNGKCEIILFELERRK